MPHALEISLSENDKLKDISQFKDWSYRFQALALGDHVWEVIKPSGTVTLTATQKDKCEQLAKTGLVLHTTSKFHADIISAASAKEAYQDLEAKYKEHCRVHEQKWFTDLCSIKQSTSESYDTYFTRVKQLYQKLESSTLYCVKEEIAVTYLIQGLSDQSIRLAVHMACKNNKTFKDAKDALKEMSVLSTSFSDTSETALAARHEQRNNDRGHRSYKHDRSRTYDKQYQSGGRRSDRRNDKYERRSSSHSSRSSSRERQRFSSKKGKGDRKKHSKKYHSKKQHQYANQAVVDSSSSSSSSSDYSSSESEASAHSSRPKALSAAVAEGGWALDSGASRHMCHNRSMFKFLMQMPHPVTIEVGDGAKLRSTHCGPIVFDDCGFVFENVLYVPGLKTNLLSVRDLTQHGLTIEFKGACVYVRNGAGKVCMEACADSTGLYMYRPPVLDEKALIARSVQTAKTWHRRFGHSAPSTLARLASRDMVKGLHVPASDFTKLGDELCVPCVMGKQVRLPFPSSASEVSGPCDLIHSDLCGPFDVPSFGGAVYVLTFQDEFSKYATVYCIPYKHSAAAVVKEHVAMCERQTGRKVKRMRHDRGGEYLNRELSDWYKSHGIICEPTSPRSPQQNGSAERLNRTLLEKTRSMLFEFGCDKRLWAEAISTAAYVVNRLPTSGHDCTPYEMFMGRKPTVSHLRVWGCRCFVLQDKPRKKLDPASREGVFVGYEPKNRSWRVWLPSQQKIVVSCNVLFDEKEPGRLQPKVELPLAKVLPLLVDEQEPTVSAPSPVETSALPDHAGVDAARAVHVGTRAEAVPVHAEHAPGILRRAMHAARNNELADAPREQNGGVLGVPRVSGRLGASARVPDPAPRRSERVRRTVNNPDFVYNNALFERGSADQRENSGMEHAHVITAMVALVTQTMQTLQSLLHVQT